ILTNSTPNDSADGPSPFSVWFRWLVQAKSIPLFVVAASFGTTSAFYFSFAVDLVANADGVSPTLGGPILFLFIGAIGFVGLFAGDAISRFDFRPILLLGLSCLAGAALLLSFAPSSWAAIGVSASLHGAGVMITSVVLSVWSSTIFPEEPSTGFAASLFVSAFGSTIGPVLLGTRSALFSLQAMFLVARTRRLLTGFISPEKRTS